MWSWAYGLGLPWLSHGPNEGGVDGLHHSPLIEKNFPSNMLGSHLLGTDSSRLH